MPIGRIRPTRRGLLDTLRQAPSEWGPSWQLLGFLLRRKCFQWIAVAPVVVAVRQLTLRLAAHWILRSATACAGLTQDHPADQVRQCRSPRPGPPGLNSAMRVDRRHAPTVELMTRGSVVPLAIVSTATTAAISSGVGLPLVIAIIDGPHRGMLPCLRCGDDARFERSMSSERIRIVRVSPGSITSSTIPRSAAI